MLTSNQGIKRGIEIYFQKMQGELSSYKRTLNETFIESFSVLFIVYTVLFDLAFLFSANATLELSLLNLDSVPSSNQSMPQTYLHVSLIDIHLKVLLKCYY